MSFLAWSTLAAALHTPLHLTRHTTPHHYNRVAQPTAGVIDTVKTALTTATNAANDETTNAAFDANNAKLVQTLTARVQKINALEDTIELLTDEQLSAKTAEFRARLERGESEDGILDEAFAVVREVAWRVLELRHYDVQLVGGIALHEGKLAQMGTGEGKTLVATCAVYLAALSGKGAFVVTVNDYLARRDAETMGQIYEFLGLSVGLVQAGLEPEARRAAYGCDVTYVTNSELGFDYLRDNLAMSRAEVVLGERRLNFCVVDEGDSVLIDEARVPLIISGKTDASVAKYGAATKLAATLEKGRHYAVSEKEQTVTLTDTGTRDCEVALAVKDLYDPLTPWASYVLNGIKAKELFIRDRNYLVQGDEVVIVDEFSGRVMEGRRWGDGLHQAIEAKEGVPVQPETEVIASITYQSLFRKFDRLASMSGTALSEAQEFETIYGLSVVDVPSALPTQRADVPSSVYKTLRGKSNAALRELLSMHDKGRPVLVGTTSVQASQAFSDKLTELGIAHEVLNADPQSAQRESEIVAQAGREKKVTISTNMAGRGTDILLGGNPTFMARLRLRAALADAADVPAPNPADSFYPCELEGELEALVMAVASRYGEQARSGAAVTTATASSNEDKAAVGARRLGELDELLAVASSSGGLNEGSIEDELRDVLDDVSEAYAEALAPEKERVLLGGGLHVIGTNLHDSRRIDGQLRGRSGRQGDPGSTHFFLSLEDRIFRLFGGDKVKGLLDFMRISEDQPLESDQVAKVVADTQQKVESYYYELRQKLFEFDEVIAVQRDATYRKRHALVHAEAAELHAALADAAVGTARDIVGANWREAEESAGGVGSAESAATILEKLGQFFTTKTPLPLTGADFMRPREEAEERAAAAVRSALANKEDELDSLRPGLAAEAERYLSLLQIDLLWKQHMKSMGFVRDFAGLRAYAQEDPLVVYQTEGLKLYDSMQVAYRQNTAYSFFQYTAR